MSKSVKKNWLWIVRDKNGQQWLCPRKPIFEKICGRTCSAGSWVITGSFDFTTVTVCEAHGCIRLRKGDGLDEDCFDGRGAKMAFAVNVVLS